MLYYRILKIEDRATTYLKQSFNLAQSLFPVPIYAGWYKVSLRSLPGAQPAGIQAAHRDQPAATGLGHRIWCLRGHAIEGSL